MMERLMRRIDVQTNELIGEMLDAIEDRLAMLVGPDMVGRDDETIFARSYVLDSKRRLNDPRFRFLLEGLR